MFMQLITVVSIKNSECRKYVILNYNCVKTLGKQCDSMWICFYMQYEKKYRRKITFTKIRARNNKNNNNINIIIVMLFNCFARESYLSYRSFIEIYKKKILIPINANTFFFFFWSALYLNQVLVVFKRKTI